jgi:hypothetical protein
MNFDPDDIAKTVAHPLVASPLGALVSLKFVPGATIVDRLVNFASGSAIAWFGAPFLADWFALTRPSSVGLLSFTSGMVGLIVVSMAIETFKNIGWRDIAQGWLARKTGGQ